MVSHNLEIRSPCVPCRWYTFWHNRSTLLIRFPPPPQDPTVGLCQGPHGGPRGGDGSYERGAPETELVWCHHFKCLVSSTQVFCVGRRHESIWTLTLPESYITKSTTFTVSSTHIYIYRPTYMHTYMYIQIYTHTHKHIFIHTYTHIYIYIYI